MKRYDLRSDTFTLPSAEMRKAMYEAEVGDDVYGEDPTVNRLQEMVEEITGKERSLLISSGCMGNLIPMMIKGGRGKEILTSEYSHIVRHEIGALSSIAATLPVIVPSEMGIMKAEDVEACIHGYSYDMSETSMIETENTTSGIVYPLDELKRIKDVADRNSLWVHMDGARIFNASVDTGISVKEYAATADDITFCLSKGLGAPALSVLSSDADFIEKARRCKKILGGGMRQIGILAAAGIWALEHNVERLRQDHEHRAMIAKVLEAAPWADVRISATNMIFFTSPYDIQRIIDAMDRRGIMMLADGGMGRIVLSLNISDEDAEDVARLIATIDEGELR